MSAVYKRGRAHIRGNLTPMIDLAFLLIVFFVLVSRMVDLESVPMELPQPKDAATEPVMADQRLVINVMPVSGGRIEGYRVGSQNFAPDQDGIRDMTAHLAVVYEQNPTVKVNVRADRGTHYEHVEPVMKAISQAARSVPALQTAQINLVVMQED